MGAGGRGGGFERGGAGAGGGEAGGVSRCAWGEEPLALCFPRGPALLRSRKMLRGPCVLHVYAFSRVLGYKKMFALFQEGRHFSLFFFKKALLSALYMMVRCTKPEVKLSFRFATILTRLFKANN